MESIIYMLTKEESEWSIMAYPTNDLYKQKIYDEDSKQDIDILIDGEAVDKDFVKSIKFKDDIFESENFVLGSAIASKFDIELNSNFKNNITTLNEMKFVFRLQTDDDTEETIPLGTYIVKTLDDSSKDYTKISLYDYMDKLNDNLDFSSIVPCTRYELLQAICNRCGLELENESILNGDVLVNTYDNTLKAKSYVSFIAERAGGYAKIIRDKLKIVNFADTEIIELPSEMAGDYNTNDLKTITKIVYENGIQKFEKGTDDGEVVYLSQESPFSCTQEEIDNLFDKLNELQFQTLEVKMWGDPSIDTGDRIKLNDIISFCQKNWTWGNGFYGNYKTVLNKTDKMSNVNKVSTSEKIRKLQSLINELDGYIEILAKETDEQDERLTQYYQDFNNFMLSVKNTGKDNLIKNSVMFAYDDNNVPSSWEVSEEGSLQMFSDTESITAGAISGHSFLLKNKKVKQKISVKMDSNDVPEEQKNYYSFCTKIKKDITGTCYVKLYNSNEEYIIELTEGEDSFYGNYEIKGLLPKDNYYIIEFYGSEDSNATFTDNMFSIGEYSIPWSQASGEIMNTQVNINIDGVLVKSSVYAGDYTVMSPLEFAGYSNINGTITKVFSLNKDTTLVKKLEAEDEVKMVPIKIVPVTTGDLQGWAFVPSVEETE